MTNKGTAQGIVGPGGTATAEQQDWIDKVKARLANDPEFKAQFEQDPEQTLRQFGVPAGDLDIVAQGGGN
jgi:hypothetical protein